MSGSGADSDSVNGKMTIIVIPQVSYIYALDSSDDFQCDMTDIGMYVHTYFPIIMYIPVYRLVQTTI